MSRIVNVAAIQMAMQPDDPAANIARAAEFARHAAGRGAEIILPPELFSDHYFCKTQREEHFASAAPWREHSAVIAMQTLAAELGVVLPVSIFEKDGPEYFNSIVMIDADGSLLGVYRKSHIPDGPGYQEKFYFKPGDTGFRVWDTQRGRIGVGICWDQWFPEAARAMALMGADLLLYPTAIGAEPQDSALDTAARWRRAMVGHAVSNVIPVIAANRVGDEDGQVFYGTSFISDQVGEIAAELNRTEEGVICAAFDLDAIDQERAAWGFFRDRRTDLYDVLV
jgi:N-carbamoylputrescine amidase